MCGKRLIKSILAASLLASISSYALETSDNTTNYGYGYGTYNGVQITSDNLLELHEQAFGENNPAYREWCQHARSLTAEWFAKRYLNPQGAAITNLDCVKKILTPPATMDRLEAHERVAVEKSWRAALGQTAINRGSNLVVRIAARDSTKEDVVVRIPSTANRWILWGSTKYYDVHYPVRPTLPDYSDIKPQEILTQQGPGMLAYALRIKQLELEHVRIPDMCPVHIPGTPEKCCDASQLIVQRFEQGLVRFSELKEEKRTEIIHNMGEKGVTDIFKAVRFGPLYNPNMCVNLEKQTQLVLTNPEQPNHTDNKQTFFYQKGIEAAFPYPNDGGDPRVENAPGKCMSNKYYHHAAADGLPRAHKWYIEKYATEAQQEQWEALSKKYAF